MDSHPAPLLAASFALTDVDARANPDTPRGERRDQIQRAAGRLGRSVAGVFGTVAAVLLQQPIDDFVMGIELLG